MGTQTKTQQLADVGVSTSKAHRYEVIAGGRDPEGRAPRRVQISRRSTWPGAKSSLLINPLL
jgi:hypothetical protein